MLKSLSHQVVSTASSWRCKIPGIAIGSQENSEKSTILFDFFFTSEDVTRRFDGYPGVSTELHFELYN